MTIKRPAIIFPAVTLTPPRTPPSTITAVRSIACEDVSDTNRGVTMKSWLVYQSAVRRVQRDGLIQPQMESHFLPTLRTEV